MLDIFRGLKNLLKVNRIHIDGSVFRLHYNATVMILIAFSVIVTTKQFVGNPIECIHSKEVTEAVINTFCWIQSTYTMNDAYDVTMVEQLKHPYLGIGTDHEHNRDQRRVHKYYQWVCFMLFFQAILFYIPRWLWKNWEGGKIETLSFDLHIGFVSESERKQKKKLLLDYLWSNLGQHSWWAGRYLFCELMCFANVLGQLWLMDRFFDGEFIEYGLRVVEFVETDQEDRVDPMIRVFPRVTKCHFRKYGSGGRVEMHDALCILPLNVVNEKIYIFLWFWFIILTCLTFVVLLCRLVILSLPRMRAITLHVRFRLVPRKLLQAIVDRTNFGDWFLFFMLGQNIDGLIFKEIMTELGERLDQEGKESAMV